MNAYFRRNIESPAIVSGFQCGKVGTCFGIFSSQFGSYIGLYGLPTIPLILYGGSEGKLEKRVLLIGCNVPRYKSECLSGNIFVVGVIAEKESYAYLWSDKISPFHIHAPTAGVICKMIV